MLGDVNPGGGSHTLQPIQEGPDPALISNLQAAREGLDSRQQKRPRMVNNLVGSQTVVTGDERPMTAPNADGFSSGKRSTNSNKKRIVIGSGPAGGS